MPKLAWTQWMVGGSVCNDLTLCETHYEINSDDMVTLYAWTRDVDRLREALFTCPSVIMEPYR